MTLLDCLWFILYYVPCMAGAEFATEASGDAESSRCDRGRIQDVYGLPEELGPLW